MSFFGASGSNLAGGALSAFGALNYGLDPSTMYNPAPGLSEMFWNIVPSDFSDFPYHGSSEYGSSFNSPSAVKEADDVVRADYSDLSDSWWSELFETAENAALKQAERNERSAVAAYERSEQAADNALNRARVLRQTAYQDAVASLKAAGLNPVLAAGGGISGSATTAPMANAPASSSGMAAGLNAADLLSAIASIISSAGNLMKGISSFLPSNVISNVTSSSTSTSSSTNTNFNYRR